MTIADDNAADAIVIGSGVGGGTVALRLVQAGLNVTVIERGDYLPREADNQDPHAVFVERKYMAAEQWHDARGRSLRPAAYYNVGGASKFYGCTMLRFRARDFDAVEHRDGVSPAWPISYADIEPYYDEAERLYSTHGTAGIDPFEPPRARPYGFPGIANEAPLQAVVDRIAGQGLRPFPQPSAIRMPPIGACVRCSSCDAYPCRYGAKADAEISAIEPALRTGRARLATRTLAGRLLLTPDGRRIDGVETVDGEGSLRVLRAKIYVVAASAVNSAALLLRSACAAAPAGVANRSGVVGRHYMAHNNSILMAMGPRPNPTVFQKNVTIMDYYFGDAASRFPLGCIISLGRIKGDTLAAANPWVPGFINAAVAARSFDWWAMSEDLPRPENRVWMSGSHIHFTATRNNMATHRELVGRTKAMLRAAGLPLVVSRLVSHLAPSHQCGTVRFGTDPASAALDPFCRSFDHDNLFVIDSSFFPSSAAVNPALTIAAQALRAADHLLACDFGIRGRASGASCGIAAEPAT